MFSFIKRAFILFFSLVIILTILVFISMEGEKNYLENCKELDIKCEEGSVHKATSSLQSWTNQTIEDIKKSSLWEDLKKKFN